MSGFGMPKSMAEAFKPEPVCVPCSWAVLVSSMPAETAGFVLCVRLAFSGQAPPGTWRISTRVAVCMNRSSKSSTGKGAVLRRGVEESLLVWALCPRPGRLGVTGLWVRVVMSASMSVACCGLWAVQWPVQCPAQLLPKLRVDKPDTVSRCLMRCLLIRWRIRCCGADACGVPRGRHPALLASAIGGRGLTGVARTSRRLPLQALLPTWSQIVNTHATVLACFGAEKFLPTTFGMPSVWPDCAPCLLRCKGIGKIFRSVSCQARDSLLDGDMSISQRGFFSHGIGLVPGKRLAHQRLAHRRRGRRQHHKFWQGLRKVPCGAGLS